MATEISEVRFSHLKAYGRSPAHGQHARTVDSKSTYPMQRGTAVHALLSGKSKVIGYPGKQRRGKEYEAFAADHEGYEILTMEEYNKAQAMAGAIRASELAAPFLQGVWEETLRFRWMGLPCRCTPDVRGEGFNTEIKTSATSEPVKFTWQALRMAYHAQMRFQQIARKASADDLRSVIVCVESEAPHPVTVFEIDPQTLELGEKLLVSWAERLKVCEAAGHFPPYTQSIFPLMAPNEDLELDYA